MSQSFNAIVNYTVNQKKYGAKYRNISNPKSFENWVKKKFKPNNNIHVMFGKPFKVTSIHFYDAKTKTYEKTVQL